MNISVTIGGGRVPGLIGLTVPAARTALTNAGLALGSQIADTSCAGKAGTITEQYTREGTVLPAGTAVNVAVATVPSGGCL